MSQLRAQMRADNNLPAPFSRQIESLLADVEAMVQSESWDAASASMTKAEQIWLTWRKSSDDWLDLLSYRQTLLERLTEDDMNPDGSYEQEVQRHLDDAFRTMPTKSSPDELRNQLRDIADQLNDYARLQQEAEQLQDMQARISADHPSYEGWRQQAFKIDQQMATLLPDDAEGRKLLHTQIQNTIAEIEDALMQDITAKASSAVAGRSGDGLLNIVAQADTIGSNRTRHIYRGSGHSRAQPLDDFHVGQLLRGCFRPSHCWLRRTIHWQGHLWCQYVGDYFALLGWGFGAEATRASVMGLLRGVGEKQADEAQ